MSAHEWKPGDVAMIRVPKASAPGFAAHERGYADVPAVRNAGGGWSALEDPDYTFHNVPPRPLVVIDPEDREQVERLLELLSHMSFAAHACGALTCLHNALREFANPTRPKPAEPTGLGAVVEDSRGVRWVRAESAKGCTNPWQASLHVDEPDEIRSLPYADVNAVRVLSEGVPSC